MIISEIRYNQAIERLRFDAEFYKPEYLEAEEVVKRFPNIKTVGEIAESIVNGVEIREYVPEGIPYLRVSDMKEVFIDISKVSKVRANSIVVKDVKLEEGDLLFSRSGTLGIICIVTSEIKGSIISSHLIRVRLKEINPFYAVIFFNCKYGQHQILRRNNGAVVPEIDQPSLKTVFIPIPSVSFQQKVESYVKEAYKKRKSADEKYKQAEALLNKILGIEKLELKQEKVFEIRFDEIEQTLRFDAEYFLPNYTEILRLLEASGFEIKRLKEISKEVIRRINPLQNPGDKFTYVEIGDIDISTGTIETKEIFGYEAPPNARKLLKEGDLIISMVRPTRGAITIIPKELNNSIGSMAFYVLNPDSPLKEFLFLYLRSSLGLNQLGRPVVGAMYPTLKKEYIEDIIIPNIPERIQTQISELVKQSFNLRKESKEILEKAKREVEEFIEKRN